MKKKIAGKNLLETNTLYGTHVCDKKKIITFLFESNIFFFFSTFFLVLFVQLKLAFAKLICQINIERWNGNGINGNGINRNGYESGTFEINSQSNLRNKGTGKCIVKQRKN